MRKHLREFQKKLEGEFPEATVQMVRARTHYIFKVTIRGAVRHISVSGSPNCAHHAVDNAIKEARRIINGALNE